MVQLLKRCPGAEGEFRPTTKANPCRERNPSTNLAGIVAPDDLITGCTPIESEMRHPSHHNNQPV